MAGKLADSPTSPPSSPDLRRGKKSKVSPGGSINSTKRKKEILLKELQKVRLYYRHCTLLHLHPITIIEQTNTKFRGCHLQNYCCCRVVVVDKTFKDRVAIRVKVDAAINPTVHPVTVI